VAGASDHIKEQSLTVTGFNEGEFPVKYLGALLTPPKKRSVAECDVLIEMIISRILRWSTRHLLCKEASVNSVVFSAYILDNALHTTKTVNKNSEAVCRNFLWSQSPEYYRTPTVAWDRLSVPKKKNGQLGIKNCVL